MPSGAEDSEHLNTSSVQSRGLWKTLFYCLRDKMSFCVSKLMIFQSLESKPGDFTTAAVYLVRFNLEVEYNTTICIGLVVSGPNIQICILMKWVGTKPGLLLF